MPPRLDPRALQVPRQLVAEDNDAMLREYRERLTERTGVTWCLAVICGALKHLKLRRKRPFGRPSGSLKMAAAVYLPATKRARSGNRTGCDGGSVGDASFQQHTPVSGKNGGWVPDGALRSFIAAVPALVSKPSPDQHVTNTSWTILPLPCDRLPSRMPLVIASDSPGGRRCLELTLVPYKT